MTDHDFLTKEVRGVSLRIMVSFVIGWTTIVAGGLGAYYSIKSAITETKESVVNESIIRQDSNQMMQKDVQNIKDATKANAIQIRELVSRLLRK